MVNLKDNSNGFSVLMSLYMKEKPEYLDRCLESLFEQTIHANEIIIVLDGAISTELTATIEKWKTFLPLKILPLKENVGLGKALNLGLKICSNDIIIRMDTDDICLENRLETQYNFLLANPDIIIVGSNIEEFTTDENIIIGKRLVPTTYSDIKKYCIIRNPFNHMSVCFRKSAIEKIGGYQHHHFMEDYNLWLRTIAAGFQVANVEQSLVRVRVGDDMLKRRSGLKYVVSEYHLAVLKYDLKLQSLYGAVTVFFIRSLPRLIPISFLRWFYKHLRK
ncbi:glycosyltransferase [Citrobacter freundii]|uniref:glycosyltransferase n=1 Tax=Citrobacter freundii TaxID=546 RepID=UPI000A38841A|nr:glycosyltransferase [Citrobacter freundii]EMB4338118.1 glycosyltransferase [Citrobacter freundii]MBJ9039884.1 glycosyltransferase [Citrobacter freundii]MDT7333193.1 glycosyltransferase [Citrobacter freundii]NTY75479.1 glycosyltransferase [Citrobacter freundii]NUA11927.1 glycosyltransferase [Citrobacter freundii]